MKASHPPTDRNPASPDLNQTRQARAKFNEKVFIKKTLALLVLLAPAIQVFWAYLRGNPDTWASGARFSEWLSNQPSTGWIVTGLMMFAGLGLLFEISWARKLAFAVIGAVTFFNVMIFFKKFDRDYLDLVGILVTNGLVSYFLYKEEFPRVELPELPKINARIQEQTKLEDFSAQVKSSWAKLKGDRETAEEILERERKEAERRAKQVARALPRPNYAGRLFQGPPNEEKPVQAVPEMPVERREEIPPEVVPVESSAAAPKAASNSTPPTSTFGRFFEKILKPAAAPETPAPQKIVLKAPPIAEPEVQTRIPQLKVVAAKTQPLNTPTITVRKVRWPCAFPSVQARGHIIGISVKGFWIEWTDAPQRDLTPADSFEIKFGHNFVLKCRMNKKISSQRSTFIFKEASLEDQERLGRILLRSHAQPQRAAS